MSKSDEEPIPNELDDLLPQYLQQYLHQRDGAAILLKELPRAFPPEILASDQTTQRAWELTGLYYRNRRQFYESLAIFSALYDQMLVAQEVNNERVHKGMPLTWMSDCYTMLNFLVHAKRYLMLTLIEDAITSKGKINPEKTGVYFRLVWGHGMSDDEVKRYAREIYNLSIENPIDCRFPEAVLQRLDNDWMTVFPEPSEVAVYSANTRYIKYLLFTLGEPSGTNLELLAEYLLSCMPGCRTFRRERSYSSDYDIVCSMEGLDVDFRSEFGRYFVCECKDWNKSADFTTMAKFCRVLDSTKSRFGILFSMKGISGTGKALDAEREQLKVFQDRGMVIVVVDQNDLEEVAEGKNFVSLLRRKYEMVRLDLRDTGKFGT